MYPKKHLQLLVCVGLTGSGKSTAVEYLAKLHIPKIHINHASNADDIHEAVDEASRLAQAGQHIVAVDGLLSWTAYRNLTHEFPGEVLLFAILSHKHLRHHRLSLRSDNPLEAHEADMLDWQNIEENNVAGPIAMANYFIENNSDLEDFYQKIDRVVDTIRKR